jgi:DNA-binding LacI/PurR family transcriptional regulator
VSATSSRSSPRPTIDAVADLVGVAPSTVSRAFRHPQLVQAATRQRIEAAARSLGYWPNAAAAALSTGRVAQLGLVIPDIENPFFPALVKAAEAIAQAQGYAVLLGHTDEDALAELATIQALARQADGLIVCSSRVGDDELSAIAATTKLVLVNRRVPGISAVVLESAAGMRQAIVHLEALGHRALAYAGGPDDSWSNRERLEAFRTSTSERGLRAVELGPYEPRFDAGMQAADAALADGVTAIVAYNDLMALGVSSRLAARGVRVPEELSVVGFDDIWIAALWSPPLTTVALPTRAAGRSATQLLLRLLDEGEAPESIVELKSTLVIRSSTAPMTCG